MTTRLWWEGPPWLRQDPSLWPRRPDINLARELPENKPIVLHLVRAPDKLGGDISTFGRLVRVVAWIWRFHSSTKNKLKPSSTTPPSTLVLSLHELRHSNVLLLRHSQWTHFPAEFLRLEQKQPLSRNNSLSSLVPYIDKDGLLRVGGRLQKAGLSTSQAHPLILSAKSIIVRLLIQHLHRCLLHAGPSTMMAVLAMSYHIPQLKRILRRLSHSCVICQKVYSRTAKQIMGELPAARTTASRPFSEVGLDFAGPIMRKRGNPRKPTLVKSYVCLFVCFATRAIHLEVVADLSTPHSWLP